MYKEIQLKKVSDSKMFASNKNTAVFKSDRGFTLFITYDDDGNLYEVVKLQKTL
jgi:hypothetical protein